MGFWGFGVLGCLFFACFGCGPVSGNFGWGAKTLDFAGVLLPAAFFFEFVFSCFWPFSAFWGACFLRVLAVGLSLGILAGGENP